MLFTSDYFLDLNIGKKTSSLIFKVKKDLNYYKVKFLYMSSVNCFQPLIISFTGHRDYNIKVT